MSERGIAGRLRIVGGAGTARLVVQTSDGGKTAVPDTHGLALAAARDEGFQAGLAAAREAAQNRLRELEQAVARLAQRLPGAWDAQLRQLEDRLCNQIVELAFRVAGQVARSPVLSTAAVHSVVTEALSLPLVGDGVEVRCHPADCAVLDREPPVGTPARLRFVPDPRLAPGDAWLSTPESGDLDGRLDGRLALLRERLHAAIVALPEDDPSAILPTGHP